MKLKLLLIFALILLLPTWADDLELSKNNKIQCRIDNIAADLLNFNKITKRIVFVYNNEDKKSILDIADELTKRQVIVYKDEYTSIENDDELAAMLAREISIAMKSYSGMWGGRIDSIQVALGSKKFQKVADKRAVDYMVKAGYNPLALITYINKTCPQKRTDLISRSNLTSKRLALIYEYLTFKYPQYLEDNEYINNKYYQNFLLTSVENRAKLKEKVRTRCTKEIKYE